MFGTSPKTTVAAILAALAVVFTNVSYIFDGVSTTNIDWGIIASQIMIIYGLFVSRDNDRTDEETGAKKAEHARSIK